MKYKKRAGVYLQVESQNSLRVLRTHSLSIVTLGSIKAAIKTNQPPLVSLSLRAHGRLLFCVLIMNALGLFGSDAGGSKRIT